MDQTNNKQSERTQDVVQRLKYMMHQQQEIDQAIAENKELLGDENKMSVIQVSQILSKNIIEKKKNMLQNYLLSKQFDAEQLKQVIQNISLSLLIKNSIEQLKKYLVQQELIRLLVAEKHEAENVISIVNSQKKDIYSLLDIPILKQQISEKLCQMKTSQKIKCSCANCTKNFNAKLHKEFMKQIKKLGYPTYEVELCFENHAKFQAKCKEYDSSMPYLISYYKSRLEQDRSSQFLIFSFKQPGKFHFNMVHKLLIDHLQPSNPAAPMLAKFMEQKHIPPQTKQQILEEVKQMKCLTMLEKMTIHCPYFSELFLMQLENFFTMPKYFPFKIFRDYFYHFSYYVMEQNKENPLNLAEKEKKYYVYRNYIPDVKPVNSQVGLGNVSQICYFNSLIQALYVNPEFAKDILTFKPCDVACTKVLQSNVQLEKYYTGIQIIEKLQELFSSMMLSQRRCIYPDNIVRLYFEKQIEQQNLDFDQQQDISEFMINFSQYIQLGLAAQSMSLSEQDIQNLNGDNQDECIDKILLQLNELEGKYDYLTQPGTFVNQKKYLHQKTNQVLDNFLDQHEEQFNIIDLSLEQKNLMKSLEEDFREVHKDIELNYQGNMMYAELQKQKWIKKVPHHLFFLIKRVGYDQNENELVKNNQAFFFDEEIYMDKFLLENKEILEQEQDHMQKMHQLKQVEADLAEIEKEKKNMDKKLADSADIGQLIESTLKYIEQVEETDAEQKKQQTTAVITLKQIDQIIRQKESLLRQTAEKLQKEISAYKPPALKQHKYRLQTIIMHQGMADYGHYFCYNYDFFQGQWTEYNDNNIQQVSHNQVFNKAQSQNKLMGIESTSNVNGLIYVSEEFIQKYQLIQSPLNELYMQIIPYGLKEKCEIDNLQLELEFQESTVHIKATKLFFSYVKFQDSFRSLTGQYNKYKEMHSKNLGGEVFASNFFLFLHSNASLNILNWCILNYTYEKIQIYPQFKDIIAFNQFISEDLSSIQDKILFQKQSSLKAQVKRFFKEYSLLQNILQTKDQKISFADNSLLLSAKEMEELKALKQQYYTQLCNQSLLRAVSEKNMLQAINAIDSSYFYQDFKLALDESEIYRVLLMVVKEIEAVSKQPNKVVLFLELINNLVVFIIRNFKFQADPESQPRQRLIANIKQWLVDINEGLPPQASESQILKTYISYLGCDNLDEIPRSIFLPYKLRPKIRFDESTVLDMNINQNTNFEQITTFIDQVRESCQQVLQPFQVLQEKMAASEAVLPKEQRAAALQ